MGIPMPPALRDSMTTDQTTCESLRRLLRDLGAPEDRVQRVIPQGDLTGQAYVYVPPLPAEVWQHLVRLLPAPRQQA